MLALNDAVLHALQPVGANLLALDHAILTLDPIGANLLALDHAVLHPLGMSRTLRHALGTELLALDAGRTRLTLDRRETLRALAAPASLDIGRLPLRRTTLDRLSALATLWRCLLSLNLIGIAVTAARASRSRR